MAVATAAKPVIVDRMDVVVAGGVKSTSLFQTPALRIKEAPELRTMHEAIYMPRLDTTEVMAYRYGISRESQDAFALQSQ